MMLQLAIIWTIVLAIIIWFVRDEDDRRRHRPVKPAARYSPSVPAYRHAPMDSDPAVKAARKAAREAFVRQLSQRDLHAAA